MPSAAKSHRVKIVRNLLSLDRAIDQLRGPNKLVALIPTMGALHEGHLSLVRLARRHADRVAVSIFVNPAQFAPHEDLGSYPRTWRGDVAKLTAEGVDLIWNPDAALMYPPGFATKVIPGGCATAGLEDRFRPHFFGGVATVVCKLFTQVRPDIAVFGEKDFQQLKVVSQMARDLDLGVKIVGAPIMRESDGLAMSSRNVYLSAADRTTAPVLFRTLKSCAAKIRSGEPITEVVSEGAKAIVDAGFALDYLEARNARTLAPAMSVADGPLRLLVAAKIGNTRLIDNIKV